MFTISDAADSNAFARAILDSRPELKPHVDEWAEREALDSRNRIERAEELQAQFDEALSNTRLPAKEFTERYGRLVGETSKKAIIEALKKNKDAVDARVSEHVPFEFEGVTE